MSAKRWRLRGGDEEEVSHLAATLELPPLLTRILWNRGIRDVAGGRSFLHPSSEDVTDPFAFPQMRRAVERIARALAVGERIVVHGDYDVDGITGTAILFETLRELSDLSDKSDPSDRSGQVDYYIPDRQADGYGVNPRVVERLRREGAGLLVTVDCGVSAHEGLERARQSGMEVIVTDHHLLPDRLPEAYAILHPELVEGSRIEDGILKMEEGKNRDDPSSILHPPSSTLSGAGMAWKLAQALATKKMEDGRWKSEESLFYHLSSLFDLVALGTIADMVPLVGENRFLVRKGLDLLSSPTLRPGLAALKTAAGIEGKRVGVGQVHFQIAPRINAPGRVAHGADAVRLLTTRDPEVAYRLARRLDELNRERQAIEEVVLDEARGEALRQYRKGTPQVLVLGSPRWHPGVIGIVAARLAEEFYRPVVLIALKDGLGKGSARSIPGFHLYEAIRACGDLLEGYGGHRYAAGLTVRTEQIETLRRRLDRQAEERLSSEDLRPTVTVDAEAAPSDLLFDLVKQIRTLEPYGVGNPEPILAFRDVEVVQSRVVGQGHLKLRVRRGAGMGCEAIGFRMGERLTEISGIGARCHLAGVPQLQEWQGTYGVQIQIRDLRSAKEPLFN